MGTIVKINESDSVKVYKNNLKENKMNLIELSENALIETGNLITCDKPFIVPIAQVLTLGAGISSILPAMRTVTQTTMVNSQGLYQLANEGVGDALKIAKNGNFWGAFKTVEGSSKLAQLKSVGSLSTTSSINMPINPATMMMAVALFSIEQKLGKILELGNQILSYLEIEKESEIEADVETLIKIIQKYKYNWDNEYFITSNHKMVLDIQRTARKNMLKYQKKVSIDIESKQLIVAHMKVNSSNKDIYKKMQYYRLSLYILSMSSLIEIMLSGNFKEENIKIIREEIEKRTFEYREIFTKCSEFLENLTGLSIETNILKGIGKATKAFGKVIGNIPVIKEGSVDEFLKDNGEQLRENAKEFERSLMVHFSTLSNPNTAIFIEKMNEMIQIYNHTTNIGFDENNIYLFTG